MDNLLQKIADQTHCAIALKALNEKTNKEEPQNKKVEIAILLTILAFIVEALVITFYFPGSRVDKLSCKDQRNSIAIKRELYSLCFNKETKQPYWVLQIISKRSFELSLKESPSGFLDRSKDEYYCKDDT